MIYPGAAPKPRLIERVVVGTASDVKSCVTVCLSAHTQCAFPIILSAGMAASGLEDEICMGWEG